MNLRTLLSISRPRFWLYSGGPFLLGFMAGLTPPRNLLTPGFWLPFLYFLLPANLLIYGVNDLADGDTDALNTKKDAYEHRLAANERRVLIGALIAAALLSVILLMALPVGTRLTFILFLALGLAYSTAPIRLKARPVLDSYSNLFYTLTGLVGYEMTAHQPPPIAITVAAFCWAAGMHAYSAIPDIVPDQTAGIRTIAVVLGERRTLLFVTANWAIGVVLAVSVLGTLGLVGLLYPVIPLLQWLSRAQNVARVYRYFPLVNGLIGFLAFLYLSTH